MKISFWTWVRDLGAEIADAFRRDDWESLAQWLVLGVGIGLFLLIFWAGAFWWIRRIMEVIR
jgi:hypothetical protein